MIDNKMSVFVKFEHLAFNYPYFLIVDYCTSPKFLNLIKETYEWHKIIDNKEFKVIPRMEQNQSIPIIASEITSYARVKLFEAIERSGFENFFYCDTDSLFVNERGYKNLKDLEGDELGQLKSEGESDEVEIIAPKNYTFGDEVKSKGVPKSARKLTPEEIEKLRKETNKKYDTDEVFEFHKFGKLNEQVGRFDNDISSVYSWDIKKTLKLNYDSRTVLSDGNTKPLRLCE